MLNYCNDMKSINCLRLGFTCSKSTPHSNGKKNREQVTVFGDALEQGWHIGIGRYSISADMCQYRQNQ